MKGIALPLAAIGIIGMILVLFIVGGGSFGGAIAPSQTKLAEIPCSSQQECNEIYEIPEGEIKCENSKCYTLQTIGG